MHAWGVSGPVLRGRRRRLIAASVVMALLGGLVTSVVGSASSAEAAAPVCSASTTQAGITIAPSHGTVFYIDSAASQRMDASYLGYVVTSSTARSDLWVTVGDFTGGSVTAADPNDTARSIGSLAAGASNTAYFLVKAGAPTTRSQSHIVTVYSGMPGLAASTVLATCSFSFSQVKETIKANSNKVSSIVTGPVDTAGMTIGQTFTITVEGDTGLIGDGTSSPDRDMMWLSPAARSSWPAGSVRLESSRIRLGSNLTNARACTTENTCQFSNVLLIRNLKTLANAIKTNAKSLSYVATYTFRVVGATSTAVPVVPVAQVSSGIQIKHTTIPQTALATIKTNDVVVNARTTKTVSTTVVVSQDPLSTTLRYTLTVANAGTSPITVDRLIDDADPTLTYVAGSRVGRSYTAAGVQSALTVREPSTETVTGDLIFSGPLSIPAGGRIEVDYSMITPTCVDGEPFSVTNSATAEIGTTIIGTSASTFQQVLARGTCGTTIIDPPTITEETIPPEVVTLAPSALGDTSATLEGTADPNGVAGSVVRFEWGTDPDFRGAASKPMGTTTTATTPQPVSGALTGLQTGTTYYYRLVVDMTVDGVTTSYGGGRQSFTTTEPVAAPVVTTLPATAVSTSGATLNATIDPNQTSSFVAFTISKSATLASGTTLVKILDDQDLPENASTNPPTPFGGSFTTPFSITLAQAGLTLAANDTWYYRADIISSTGTVLSSGVIRSVSLVTTAPQSVAFDPVSDATISDGSASARAAATSGLTPAVRSETPSICRVDTNAAGVVTLTLLDVGDCTLVAEQEGGNVGGTVYEPAPPATTTFAVTRAPRTLALDDPDDLLDWGGTPPHVNATPSRGADDGTISYRTVNSAGVCTVDAATGVVTVLGPGTCQLASDISVGARHQAATSSTVSFTIGVRPQELTLPDASLSLSSPQLELSADSSATTHTEGMGTIEYRLVGSDANSAGCTITNGQLTASAIGSCLVEARRGGNTHWTDAVTQARVTVSDKAARSIELRVPTDGGTAPVPTSIDDWSTTELDVIGVPSETDSDDAISYTTLPGTTACTVDAATGRVVITGAGDCVLRSAVSETARRTGAASTSTTIHIGPRPQTITDFTGRTVSADSDGADLASGTNATTNATGIGEAQYRIDEGSTDGCRIVNGRLEFTQAGDCVVVAARSGNAHWTAAEARVTIVVERASRRIDFDDATTALTEVTDWSAAPHGALATPSAGTGDGAVSYSAASASGACRINASTGLVEFLGAGSCTLRAAVAQGARYNAAQADEVTFTIGKRDQRITGLADATRWATETSVALAPQSNATVNDTGMGSVGITLVDDGGGACRLVAGELKVDAAGECIVEAQRSGNAHWTDATRRAVLRFDRVPRSLTLGTVMSSTPTWMSAAPGLTVRISADPNGGAVRYAATDGSACTIDAVTGAMTLLRAGTCTLSATIGQSARYHGATAEPVSFTIDREPQRITNLPTGTYPVETPSLPLEGLSNAIRLDEGIGPISYRAVGVLQSSAAPSRDGVVQSATTAASGDGAAPQVCTVEGDQLVILGAGICEITASRVGNDNWTSAVATSQIVITLRDVTGVLRLASGRTRIPAGDTDRALLTLSTPHPGTRTWSATSGVCTVDVTGAVRALAPGTCTITVRIPSTDRLSAVTAQVSVLITAVTPPPTSGPTAPPPTSGPTPEPTRPPMPTVEPTEPSQPVQQPVDPSSAPPATGGEGDPTTLRDPIGVRTVPELARESVSGFAPGSAVRAELSGARTVAQFVVADSSLDEVAVMRALTESAGRHAGSFATVTSVTPGTPDSVGFVSTVGPALTRLFTEARLGAPRPITDLPLERAERWVNVAVEAEGLVPASRVALAVTSEPTVVDDAIVRDDGTATLSGWIPIDLLDAGPHSLRIVGVRTLLGATVDESGSVHMTDEIIAQVNEFDPGTAATLTIVGTTENADTIIAQRRILLDDITPWWSIALLAFGVLGVGFARRRRQEWTARCIAVAVSVVSVLTVVVAVAGWYAAAYGIYVIGAVLAIVGLLIATLPRWPVARRRRRGRQPSYAPLDGEPGAAFA